MDMYTMPLVHRSSFIVKEGPSRPGRNVNEKGGTADTSRGCVHPPVLPCAKYGPSDHIPSLAGTGGVPRVSFSTNMPSLAGTG
jgi:hypothetical protein